MSKNLKTINALLNRIEEDGLQKTERIIETPQGVKIKTNDSNNVLNFMKDYYFFEKKYIIDPFEYFTNLRLVKNDTYLRVNVSNYFMNDFNKPKKLSLGYTSSKVNLPLHKVGNFNFLNLELESFP